MSTWQLLESLAGGTAALMQWRLRTGRTHQIRVHAKHMGHPLLCDESYGGAGGTAVNVIGQGKSTRCASSLSCTWQAVDAIAVPGTGPLGSA